MLVTLKAGTSSYKHIPVLELSPKQLKADEDRARVLSAQIINMVESLPDRLRTSNYLFTQSLPEVFRDIVIYMGDYDGKKKPTDPDDNYQNFLIKNVQPFIEKINQATHTSSLNFLSYFLKKINHKYQPFSKDEKAELINTMTNEMAPFIHAVSMEEQIRDSITTGNQSDWGNIRKEQTNNRFHLRALDEWMAGENIPFDSEKMGQRMMQENNRIMSSGGLIATNYLFHDNTHITNNLIAAGFCKPDLTKGYAYRFGFAKTTLPSSQLVTTAIYLLDPRVLDALKTHSGDNALDAKLLNGFLSTARLADHDYWHHMTLYPNNKDFRGTDQPSPKDASQLIRSLIIDKIGTINYKGMQGYEPQSMAIHYLTLQQQFARQPHVKQRVLEQAVSFLQNVRELKKRMEADPKSALEAERTADYLKNIYEERLFHIIPYADVDTKVNGQDGKTTTLREQLDAISMLSPPPEVAYGMMQIDVKNNPLNHTPYMKESYLHRAGHSEKLQAERQQKSALRQSLHLDYFLDKDGGIAQLQRALDSASDTNNHQQMQVQLDEFRLLLGQVATRIENGTLGMVTTRNLAIGNTLPKAAENMKVLADEQILAKLNDLLSAWPIALDSAPTSKISR
jgi:hypothetical protein